MLLAAAGGTGQWLHGPAGGAEPPASTRSTGSSTGMATGSSTGLRQPVDATWSGASLADVLGRLSELADRPIVVDRRIDPGTTVSRRCRGEPLDAVLAAVAAAAGGEVAVLRSCIRIVPVGRAAVVLRAERSRERAIAALPEAARRRLTGRGSWSWPEAARPRDLLEQEAAEAGVALDGLATVPHDHFPTASLPPLPLADRLDMIAAHFDRRIAWRIGPARPAGDPTLLGTLVAIDAPGEDGVGGPVDDAAEAPSAAGDRRNASGPDAPPPDSAGPRPAPRPGARGRLPPKAGGRTDGPPPPATFSLRAEATLERLLAEIADRMKLALDIDVDSLRARGISAAEVVRVNVTDVSRDALLDAVLAPLDLRWKVEGDRLRVFAPAP